MEEIYIGTKVISGEPMNEMEWYAITGRVWDQNRPDRQGYKVRYEDGYVSWSPKETFERAYRKVTAAERALMNCSPVDFTMTIAGKEETPPPLEVKLSENLGFKVK